MEWYYQRLAEDRANDEVMNRVLQYTQYRQVKAPLASDPNFASYQSEMRQYADLNECARSGWINIGAITFVSTTAAIIAGRQLPLIRDRRLLRYSLIGSCVTLAFSLSYRNFIGGCVNGLITGDGALSERARSELRGIYRQHSALEQYDQKHNVDLTSSSTAPSPTV